MLFPTVTFAVFFLIVLPVSWALMPHQRVVAGLHPARELRLLRLVGLALRLPARRLDGREPCARGCDLPGAGASGAQAVAHARRSRSTSGLLGYFKYTNFFLSSIDNTIGTSWIAHVTLPVGISFYTFMAISYVVDTYRGELVPASFARFAVFQAFFPHLVAGPIVRASELLPQLERPRDPRGSKTRARSS